VSPSNNELRVLRKHADRIGLDLEYDPSGRWDYPWKFTRRKSRYEWRVKTIDRVHFHLGNELSRTKRLKRIATRLVGA